MRKFFNRRQRWWDWDWDWDWDWARGQRWWAWGAWEGDRGPHRYWYRRLRSRWCRGWCRSSALVRRRKQRPCWSLPRWPPDPDSRTIWSCNFCPSLFDEIVQRGEDGVDCVNVIDRVFAGKGNGIGVGVLGLCLLLFCCSVSWIVVTFFVLNEGKRQMTRNIQECSVDDYDILDQLTYLDSWVIKDTWGMPK